MIDIHLKGRQRMNDLGEGIVEAIRCYREKFGERPRAMYLDLESFQVVKRDLRDYLDYSYDEGRFRLFGVEVFRVVGKSHFGLGRFRELR